MSVIFTRIALILGILLQTQSYASEPLDQEIVNIDHETYIEEPDGSYIIPPLETAKNPMEKALIIIPGGLVPNHHYLALAKEIQKNIGFKLWVGILSCKRTANLCSPIGPNAINTKTYILTIQEKISERAQTLISSRDLFIAGHSLGGQSAFLAANEMEDVGGVILWAS